VREKRGPVVMVELLEKATLRLVRWEIREAHSVEPAAPRLAVEERQALVTLRRAVLARSEQRSGRLGRAFFAPDRQL
jgi:hypothetical protein